MRLRHTHAGVNSVGQCGYSIILYPMISKYHSPLQSPPRPQNQTLNSMPPPPPFRLDTDPGPPNGLTPHERHMALLGQMRSLAALAEWERLSTLCSREWIKSEPHMR